MKPLEIKKIPNEGLSIKWSSGAETFINQKKLRANCPCAECLQKRGEDSHENPLTPKKKKLQIVEHTYTESITLENITAIGNYGLKLQWADNHQTGIYTFEFLAELSDLKI